MMIDTQAQRSHGMTVDIRLCGNLTRKEVKEELYHRGALCSLGALPSRTRCVNVSNELHNAMEKATHSIQKKAFVSSFSSLFMQDDTENEQAVKLHEIPERVCAPIIEVPTWAQPAKGEARLEVRLLFVLFDPEFYVCCSHFLTLSFLNVSFQPVCDSVGRQVSVDLTTKSSFRLGRSPNSDVQLLHATSSRKHAILFHHANGSCYIVDCGSAYGTFVNGKRVSSPCNGVVLPQKVKKGSIVRFGGPGSPCFILKSFSSIVDDRSADCQDMGVLVRRNTRLNATGDFAKVSNSGLLDSSILNVLRKRSFESLSISNTLDEEERDPFYKRMRCSSPPPSPEEPIRLVSPELSVTLVSKARRVTFSPESPQICGDVFIPSVAVVTENSKSLC
jgi:FHA domain